MQGKLLYGVGGLIIGLAAGFFAANSLNRQAAVSPSSAAATVGQAPAGSVTGSNSQPSGMQGDVAETLRKAESEPSNFAAQMQAGDMYAQIGRFDRAVEFYLKGLNLNPQNAAANVVLANAYFDSQRFEDAEKYYSKALELDPSNVNARTDLGATFVERKAPDYNRAIEEFRKALQQDPKSAPARYYMGIAHLRKGDRGEAEKILGELEKDNPQSELVSRLRQNLIAKPTTQ
jgi:tetratricopeptide (TPR) repeat protein